MKLTALLTAATFGLVAGSAGAAPITFDLQGWDSTNYYSLPSAFSLTQDGLTATFDGKAFSSVAGSGGTITSATVEDGRIGRYLYGAGVTNSPYDGSHTVDGYGWDDFIEISFSAMVEIKEIVFGYYGSYDDFRYLTDASGDGSIGVGDAYSAQFSVASNNPFSGFGGLTTDIFAVAAFGNNDSWKLQSVTVERLSAVPLPAAGWMLLGAIGGLGFMRRCRKA